MVEQLSNQRQIIVKEFGFSSIDTTLLGCVDGVFESACMRSNRVSCYSQGALCSHLDLHRHDYCVVLAGRAGIHGLSALPRRDPRCDPRHDTPVVQQSRPPLLLLDREYVPFVALPAPCSPLRSQRDRAIRDLPGMGRQRYRGAHEARDDERDRHGRVRRRELGRPPVLADALPAAQPRAVGDPRRVLGRVPPHPPRDALLPRRGEPQARPRAARCDV